MDLRLFVDGVTLPRIFIKKSAIYFCIFDSHSRVAKCSCFVQRICRQYTSTSVPAVDFSAHQVSRGSLHCQFCWLFCSFYKQVQFWFFSIVRFCIVRFCRLKSSVFLPLCSLISGRSICSLFSLTNFDRVRRLFNWRYIGSGRMFKSRSWFV